MPLWFVGWDLVRVGLLQGFRSFAVEPGLDFQIYRAAGAAVAHGTDPWQAGASLAGAPMVHFAALPIAAQLMAPFALLPVAVGFAIWTAASLVVMGAALRRLRLPLWWLLFPPVVEALLAGNPQVPVIALLVLGLRGRRQDEPSTEAAARGRLSIVRSARAIAGAVAALLKIYALVPLIARRDWRGIAVVGAVVALSVATAPGLWQTYISQFSAISSRLVAESGGGTSALGLLTGERATGPVAIIAVVVALALILAVAWRDVGAAGWLVVPLLWPAAEYHYATMALPVMRRLGAVVMAMAVPGSALVGVGVLALRLVVIPRRIDEAGDAVLGLRGWIGWWMRSAPSLHDGEQPPTVTATQNS